MATKEVDYLGMKLPKGTRERVIIDGLRKRGTNISALLKNCIWQMGSANPQVQLSLAEAQRDALVQEVHLLGAKIKGLNDYIETLQREIESREVLDVLH